MKMLNLRGILLLLGIAGIVAYSLYPNEKKTICLELSKSANHPYGGAQIDGIAFKCILENENENCGIGFSFDSKIWNLMDSLILNLQSSENFKELIAQISTDDPDHTELDDRSTMKPFLKEISLKPGANRYSVPMDYFYTPDYWFEQQNAKNTHNAKKFSAVTGIELFSGWKNPAKTPLSLKIESICAEGISNTPFVILILYLGGLIATAVGVRVTQPAQSQTRPC